MEATSPDKDEPICAGCRERDRRIAELEQANARAVSRIAELEARIADLERKIEDLTRRGKRQAAPFSKGAPKANPKKPGRKPGDDYGPVAFRAAPDPEQIDETHHAPLPEQCSACGGKLEQTGTVEQYQVEIPRTPIHRKFIIAQGRCTCCSKRVQGRHELQTSDAVGAASSQIGPEAQATMIEMNKRLGLSHGKIARFFTNIFGIEITRSGVCQAILRGGERCRGEYQQLVNQVRGSPSVTADETGWRVGGALAWLHTAVSDLATVYLIDPKRGIEAMRKLLPLEYNGRLIHDGWAPYDRYLDALHQTCLGHLLARVKQMLEIATRGAVIFPRKVKAILTEAMSVRDRRDAGEIALEQAIARAAALEARMERITLPHKTHAGNERLAAHLHTHLSQLFTFLREPGIEATNWRAEQALRPAVVNRKVWGGNRTWRGADVQMILMSVLATLHQRGDDVIDALSHRLRRRVTVPSPTSTGR